MSQYDFQKITQNTDAVLDKETGAIVGLRVDTKLKLFGNGVSGIPNGTAITGIDLKPTEVANQFTVEISWTDANGNAQTTTDPTPITIVGGEGASAANTDSLAEGTSNLYHTDARVRATTLTGLSTATNSAVVAGDTILVGVGKLQAQMGLVQTALTAILGV